MEEMVKVNIRIAIASVAISAALLSAVMHARAQATGPARKPIAESSIKLPGYFGVYAVQKSGEVMVLKPNMDFDAEHLSVTLPEDVEFLIYGKDIDPSKFRLDFLGLKGETAREIELLAKPVSNQPQMLRLIPASTLPGGGYKITENFWEATAVFGFVVGPMPKGVVTRR